jgi:hypothetical protein
VERWVSRWTRLVQERWKAGKNFRFVQESVYKRVQVVNGKKVESCSTLLYPPKGGTTPVPACPASPPFLYQPCCTPKGGKASLESFTPCPPCCTPYGGKASLGKTFGLYRWRRGTTSCSTLCQLCWHKVESEYNGKSLVQLRSSR